MDNSFLSFVSDRGYLVHNSLENYLRSREVDGHYKIVREYFERGSGYTRPGFVFLGAEMHGIKEIVALLPATTIQLFQEWMLIHDDVEDCGEIRRGKPTLNKIYGDALAINAGDHLHMESWNVVKDFITKYGMRRGKRIYDKFYDIAKTTIEGQYLDLDFTIKKDISLANEKLYYKIADMKSAYYSVYGPLQIGALLSETGSKRMELFKEIGKPVGIAAQIHDDVLDFEGKAEFGKRRYQDLYEGKMTLIIIHAFQNATMKEKMMIKSIYSMNPRDKTLNDIDFLLYIIRKYNSVNYAKSQRDKLGKISESILAENKRLFKSHHIEILNDAIKYEYTRPT